MFCIKICEFNCLKLYLIKFSKFNDKFLRKLFKSSDIKLLTKHIFDDNCYYFNLLKVDKNGIKFG